mmetsp:Transcript_3013/g.5421  ORF Transcript_3013/g.5421 Transcript_3013/m.5421 type:complete len:131 (+) Transcript_3013:99-491(+)
MKRMIARMPSIIDMQPERGRVCPVGPRYKPAKQTSAITRYRSTFEPKCASSSRMCRRGRSSSQWRMAFLAVQNVATQCIATEMLSMNATGAMLPSSQSIDGPSVNPRVTMPQLVLVDRLPKLDDHSVING